MANWARRAARKAEHRERLIASASELFAKNGYWGVSLDDVAERARLTKGAVYSIFGNKEKLLLAVAAKAAIDLELPDPELPLAQQLRLVGERVAALASSNTLRSVVPRELELSTIALSSQEVREAMETSNRRQIAFVAGYLEEVSRSQGVALVMTPEQVATLLLALRTGLMHLRLLDKGLAPNSYFEDAFELLALGAVTNPRGRAPAGGRRPSGRRGSKPVH